MTDNLILPLACSTTTLQDLWLHFALTCNMPFLTALRDTIVDLFQYFWLGSSWHADQTRCLYYSTLRTLEDPTFLSRDSLPPKEGTDTIRLVIVSDTHSRHESLGDLPSGDVFIHAGDTVMKGRVFSAESQRRKLESFNAWLGTIPCRKKIVVAGNHDQLMDDIGASATQALLTNATYLENSTCSYEGFKFFGSPLSTGRSNNSAFQSRCLADEAVEKLTDNADSDILITHGPELLLSGVLKQPLLHVWGHIHDGYGVLRPGETRFGRKVAVTSVNGSTMDTKYRPSNAPLVVDISRRHVPPMTSTV